MADIPREKTPTLAARRAASYYLMHKLGGRRGVGRELEHIQFEPAVPGIWREIVYELAHEFDAFFARAIRRLP